MLKLLYVSQLDQLCEYASLGLILHFKFTLKVFLSVTFCRENAVLATRFLLMTLDVYMLL